MLSVFPSLLTFGIFAPLFLRLTAGIFFFYSGYRHFGEERMELVRELSQKFSSAGKAIAVTLALVEMLLGLFLIAGFLTQVMALLGMIFTLKLLWFKNKYPLVAKHEKVVYALLFVIFLSLLFTGAGAPAVDLPL
ncbi:DoxX family membrane protein [Candidatus Kaiserbacteria bacterium]|nr:DoxX family membrane protein [Candidatus Kaiserbacteria bacterium]